MRSMERRGKCGLGAPKSREQLNRMVSRIETNQENMHVPSYYGTYAQGFLRTDLRH